MSSSQETFSALLKSHGQSVTKARLAVFEALLGEEPLAMREVVARTKGVDRASVYRAIDLFEKLGIVQRLNSGWKYKIELSDKFAAHHHHLSCVGCGKTIAISGHELETFIDQLATHYGFAPTAHQIEIQGYCKACRAAGKGSAA